MAKATLDSRFLVVKGQGIVTAPPDLLLLSALIRCGALEYSKTINKLNKKTNLMRNAVEKCGIPRSDIKTTFFGVNIDQRLLKKKTIVRVFVAQHFLHVKIPLKQEKIKAVFQAIATCGAEPKMTITFDVAEPEVMKLKAIEAAVANARSRAQLIVQAADQKLGRIKNIDYEGGSEFYNPRFSMEMVCGLTDHASAPDLEPQEISATERVTITWEILS